MQTHSSIIAKAGVSRVAAVVPGTSIHTITSWRQRNSIPGEYWAALAAEGIATLDELASAAAARKQDMEKAA